jgi:hypothetical protein
MKWSLPSPSPMRRSDGKFEIRNPKSHGLSTSSCGAATEFSLGRKPQEKVHLNIRKAPEGRQTYSPIPSS